MLEAVIGVMGAVLMAVIGWAFNLSNRVAVLEAERANFNTLLNERFAAMEKLLEIRLTDITRRLGHIEDKLDAKA